jgi:hypothetical protein
VLALEVLSRGVSLETARQTATHLGLDWSG